MYAVCRQFRSAYRGGHRFARLLSDGLHGQAQPRERLWQPQHRPEPMVQPPSPANRPEPLHRPLPLVNRIQALVDEKNDEYVRSILRGMNVLLFSNHANTLTRYIASQLREYGVKVSLREVQGEKCMLKAVDQVQHDVILCPFLTKRIPEEIWSKKDVPCLIVHPGIPGDRGACSIDWALKRRVGEWGVTVMQAVEEMDAGDIYAAKTFPILEETTTKTEMYGSDITDAALDAALLALIRFKLGIKPVPLDYKHPEIRGSFMPMMKKADRRVDWSETAFEVAKTIRMSDTQPGALGRIYGFDMDLRLYGAKYIEKMMLCGDDFRDVARSAEPGQILGWKEEAILVKCGDNSATWISHLKDTKCEKPLKLPATTVLSCKEHHSELSHLKSYRELWTEVRDGVCYVHFDFYNGAMSVTQCRKLRNILAKVSYDPDVKAVALMGGYRFFSTGIHLNVIEAADDPVAESYANIVAIDDVIREVFSMEDKLTVAVMQGNAGAGGVMMAQACDLVLAHKSAMLTPTYKAMHLYGSEYWTYFLPRRVGEEKALELINGTESFMASTAQEIGLVDRVLGRTRREMLERLHGEIQTLLQSPEALHKVEEKQARMPAWYVEAEQHREMELQYMKNCFTDPQYHLSRSKFVYH